MVIVNRRRRGVTFPCKFGGKRVNIKIGVIGCVIPLFLSRHSMNAAGMIISMAEDTAVVFSDTVNFRATSTGHYALPLFSYDAHNGNHSLSGVREHPYVAFKSSSKKEKTAREHTWSSYPNKRSLCSKTHRCRHVFDVPSSPHGCPSTRASRPLRAPGVLLALH